MLSFKLITVLLAAKAANGAVNEPCVGADGRAGVCIDASTCESKGGVTIANACPKTPTAIKCCTKASCGDTSLFAESEDPLLFLQDDALVAGNCRWSSDCAGSSIPNQCPGPSGFKCCQSSEEGFGGYDQPPSFGKADCKQVAIDGAEKIVAQFPGRIREVGCKRSCDCGSDDSDHCCGLATDMMCSDATETASMSGFDIATWVMNNRNDLNLKYVIWGQRIWQPSVDQPKPWNEWKVMEDRGNVRENHWDHVHVSYNN